MNYSSKFTLMSLKMFSELIYDVQDAIKEIYSELNKIQGQNLLEEMV